MLITTPINEDFVAEISGLDLTSGINDSIGKRLVKELDKYAVLIVPGQPLAEDQQLQIARHFGPLETSFGSLAYDGDDKRRLKNKHLSDISNLDADHKILDENDIRHLINVSNQLWHADSSFKETPAYASLLSAQEIVPVGGRTEFADMRKAWGDLPADMKEKIADMVAVHDYFFSRAKSGFDADSVPSEWRAILPPVEQVLVRNIDTTGRRSLYLASHIRSIVGMSEKESQELVASLMNHATQKKYVYSHRWRVDDLVIWDNRTTMHRGTPFDRKYRRSMRRATVEDRGPTVL